jgi:predicted ATPase
MATPRIGQAQTLEIVGYRSIKRIDITFDSVNVVTGPNGCGKSNLFNAFRLIKAATEGRLSKAIVEEGGLDSILWAGPAQKGPARMSIALSAHPFDYSLELGTRPASEFSLFPKDPQIKSEVVRLAGKVMVDRKSSVGKIFTAQGKAQQQYDLNDAESIFSQIGDPEEFHYLYTLRELVARWTFYHEFRTDAGSPLRRPPLQTLPTRLDEDGGNLGPMLYLIQERGEADMMQTIIASAFPGSRLVAGPSGFVMEVEGLRRKMQPPELSDGTLKFLCLVAACFAPRPAPLLAFNEPETSLNTRLFEPLADMLTHAAQYSQLWVTTHSEELNRALVDRLACKPIRLDKVDGETVRAGLSRRNVFALEEEWENREREKIEADEPRNEDEP